MLGNFNVLLYEHEKKGGNTSHLEGRLDLMDFINKEDLMDMDLQGIDFMWSNKRVGYECIQAFLDRFLISLDQTNGCVFSLSVIQKIASNHFPLQFKDEPFQARNNFPFRFEKMWMQHPNFNSLLKKWWNIKIEGSTLFCVANKLKNVKKRVRDWNKNYFGDIFERKSNLKVELQIIQDNIQSDGYSEELVKEENEKLEKYHDIISKEET